MGTYYYVRPVRTGHVGEVSHGGHSPIKHSPRLELEVVHSGCSQDYRGDVKGGEVSIQASFGESAKHPWTKATEHCCCGVHSLSIL